MAGKLVSMRNRSSLAGCCCWPVEQSRAVLVWAGKHCKQVSQCWTRPWLGSACSPSSEKGWVPAGKRFHRQGAGKLDILATNKTVNYEKMFSSFYRLNRKLEKTDRLIKFLRGVISVIFSRKPDSFPDSLRRKPSTPYWTLSINHTHWAV